MHPRPRLRRISRSKAGEDVVGKGVGEIVIERSMADKHPIVNGPVEDVDGHLRVEVLSELAALDAKLEYLPGFRPPYRKPART